MMDKPKGNKIVLKKSGKGGTIADQISHQQHEKEKKVEAAKAEIQQKVAEPANPTSSPQILSRPAASVPQEQRPVEKREDKRPPRERTVFIEPTAPVVPPVTDASKPKKATPAKKKSNLREDILKQKEHEKFFIGKGSKGRGGRQDSLQSSSIPSKIKITEFIQVGELARKLNIKTSDIITKLMRMGVMATITQSIDAETVTLVASEYGVEVELVSLYDETLVEEEQDKEEELQIRPPVVTIMGHVDHGKTKLLDALRETDIASGEAGGITQHIGAYQVTRPKGKITFLDTPGHEAFTAMRARGAKTTDIVVLVVAADDGVMPQTVEAISHARDAKVPIIVAVNKVDKPEANPERVRQELMQYNLVPEEWGGDTTFVEVSALKKLNLDKLEEAILTLTEVMELKASPTKRAVGTVIEAKLDQGRGPVATILVSAGTLRVGDPFLVGVESGRVRAMHNDKGQRIDEAPPAMPVEIIGLSGVPNAGDPFHVLESEKEVKSIAEKRQELARQQQAQQIKKVKLENLSEFIEDGKIQEFKIILKADVRGSVEALQASLEKLSSSQVRVNVVFASTGEINESDVMLASAANALVIGFNTRANKRVKDVAANEHVEIRYYSIIYQVIDDVKSALAGMLSPDISEEITGELEIRQTFKISAVGTVAGCMVTSGFVKRNNPIRVVREGVVIYTGKLKSLKRFQEDVGEVREGFECGILLENYNDIKEGDIIESYMVKETKRTYESIIAEDKKRSDAAASKEKVKES